MTETTTLTDPTTDLFDSELYETLMALESISDKPSGHTWTGGYDTGYEVAAGYAARIVAERAATAPTDEAVEAAARAMCAAQFPEVSPDYAWSVQFDDGKGEYRRDATAALNAALPFLQPTVTEAERIKAMALAYDREYHRAPEGSERRDFLQACQDSMAQALAVGGVGEGAKVELRPDVDLTLDVLRRLKARRYPRINPSAVSVITACVLESLNEQNQGAS